jgi:phytoene synthase
MSAAPHARPSRDPGALRGAGPPPQRERFALSPAPSAPTPDVLPESRALLAKHARSFRLASVFLPADRRDDAAICYAFCRVVDDAADTAADTPSAIVAVDGIRAELRGRQAARPMVAAWRIMALRNRIPVTAAYDLLDGVRSDLDPVRIADDDELLRYCYRVAGTVGIMMCGILGVRDRVAIHHAVDLGVAMQLTNIARDVAEDAGLGRVYLPRTRLVAAGTTPEALLDGSAPRDRVARVVCELLELAEKYYASADAGMRFIPWRSRLAMLAASRLYRNIGRALLRKGGDALAGRTVLGSFQRGVSVAAAFLASFHPTVLGLVRPAHDRALHDSLRGLPGAHA